MDDGIQRQDRQLLHRPNYIGVEYSTLYMCKAKPGMKREEAYKLPHRLIEKKRRDRINECIGQLKDMLPEHLKLTTLGHLEKAVVLELTLKHLNTLTAVKEQQHRQILALQSGGQSMKSAKQKDLDAFRAGFQTCTKEVLRYLSRVESWSTRERRFIQLINHLHQVSAPLITTTTLSCKTTAAAIQGYSSQRVEMQARCVPVIQRSRTGEATENDTDTDSGYGGEKDKSDRVCDSAKQERQALSPNYGRVKQESEHGPPAKKTKTESKSTAVLNPDPSNRPDMALLNPLVGLGGVPFGQQFCLPFYIVNSSATAPYTALADKAGFDQVFYPAAAAVPTPFPLLYPGLAAQIAAFPGWTSKQCSDKNGESAGFCQSGDSSCPESDASSKAKVLSIAEKEQNLDSDDPQLRVCEDRK